MRSRLHFYNLVDYNPVLNRRSWAQVNDGFPPEAVIGLDDWYETPSWRAWEAAGAPSGRLGAVAVLPLISSCLTAEVPPVMIGPVVVQAIAERVAISGSVE